MNKILILDDDVDFRNLLHVFLKPEFPEAEFILYDPVHLGIPDENYDWSKIDILLLDHFLCIKGYTGLDILRQHYKKQEFPATVMLTASADEELALKVLNLGAYEFIRKQKLEKNKLIWDIKRIYSQYQIDIKKRLAASKRKQALSKSNFYKRLRQTSKGGNKASTRVLILLYFSPVKSQSDMRQQILLRDNTVKYAASISYNYFSCRDLNVTITPVSARSVAVLLESETPVHVLNEQLRNFHQFHLNNNFSENQNLKYYQFSTAALIYSPVLLLADQAIERLKYTLDQAEQREHFFIETMLTQKDIDNINWEVTLNNNNSKVKDPNDSVHIETDSVLDEIQDSNYDKANLSKQLPLSNEHKEPTTAPLETKSKATTEQFSLQDFDIELDAISSDRQTCLLSKAFEERRVILNYRSIISFVEQNNPSGRLLYTSFEMIDEKGARFPHDQLFNDETKTEIKQYVARWVLKELISCIFYCQLHNLDHIFILRLSDCSFSDMKFFAWLRELLLGLAGKKVGKQIILEVRQCDFIQYKKQCQALVNFLVRNHNFQIALSDIHKPNDLIEQISNLEIDYLICSTANLDQILNLVVEHKSQESLIDYLDSRGISIICDGINDSIQLMEAIAKGVSYAMGGFIGESSTELDSLNEIESMVEIEY